MAKSGSENRKRSICISVRMSPDEANLVRSFASKAGVSVAGLIRYALLDQKPVRASRQPSLCREDAARILGMLGPLKDALNEAARNGNLRGDNPHIEAAMRDIADMRAALMQALGKDI